MKSTEKNSSVFQVLNKTDFEGTDTKSKDSNAWKYKCVSNLFQLRFILLSYCCRASPRWLRTIGNLSWKVRYRTFPWFFIQMIKLYKARSLLYRRQILQENIRWKALDEIYKIYMLLHRSDLNISEIFRQTFSHFSAKCCKIYQLSKKNHCILLRFWWNLSEFRKYFRKCWKILNVLNFLAECTEFWRNFYRTLMWKVRMVRSLADRTFQIRFFCSDPVGAGRRHLRAMYRQKDR